MPATSPLIQLSPPHSLSPSLCRICSISPQVTKEEGLNKLFFAFDPEYIPHVCPADIAPQDALHLFPDGILRSEGAWLVYILIKLGLTIDQMNEALRKYPHFPRDCRIPPLHEKLKEGRAGGRPKSDKTLRMSGSQVMHFAIHSIHIFDPLLTAKMRRHPAWMSWLKMVELFLAVIQHKLSMADARRIDDLQIEHSQLFDQVGEYSVASSARSTTSSRTS